MNIKMSSVLVEAIVVGCVISAIWFLLQGFDTIRRSVNQWMQVFLAGMIGHLVFEALGINRWYCHQGAACSAR